jgi:hypothetical protein
MRSIVPVEHLEVVANGAVVAAVPLAGDRTSADTTLTLPAERSGWYTLRAWSEHATHPVLDIYPFATTSPVYVTVGGAPARSAKDAAYFVAWIDRLAAAARDAGVIAVVGITERDSGNVGTLYNTNVVLGADGTLLGKHRKLVPTFGERAVWRGGDGSTLDVWLDDAFRPITSEIDEESG